MAQQRNTQIIPRASAARILMNSGAQRVAADGAQAFSEVIYNLALKIGEQAVRIARHSGRKTVHEGDIKLAASH